MDVKALQERVAAKVPGKRMGTSYGSVWSYVNGKAPQEPRRETVEAMADILGVRPEYLLFDEPRTEAARIAEEQASAIDTGHSWPAEWRPILDAFPEFDHLDPAVRIMVMRLLEDVTEGTVDPDATDDELMEAIGRKLGLLLALLYTPLLTLRAPVTNLPPTDRRFTRYAVAMLHAIEMALMGPPAVPGEEPTDEWYAARIETLRNINDGRYAPTEED